MDQNPHKPAGMQRTGGRSARVREAVLNAAIAELLEHGFDDFSMARVAQGAGVHVTSVYRRWGNRQALVVDAVSDVGHAPVPDTGSLRDDLIRLLMDVRDLMQSPMGRAFEIMAINAEPDKPFHQPFMAFWRHRLAELLAIFERAERRGEWPTGRPARPCLDALVGAVLWRVMMKDAVPDAYIEQAVSLQCVP